jgi:hypothetical protein
MPADHVDVGIRGDNVACRKHEYTVAVVLVAVGTSRFPLKEHHLLTAVSESRSCDYESIRYRKVGKERAVQWSYWHIGAPYEHRRCQYR